MRQAYATGRINQVAPRQRQRLRSRRGDGRSVPCLGFRRMAAAATEPRRGEAARSRSRERLWEPIGVSRNSVLAAAPLRERAGFFRRTGGNPRPRSGLRGRATGTDGASRSRYQSVGPSGVTSLFTPEAKGGEPAGPEEPSARTPALGWPAGALRWRVTVANRSGVSVEVPGGPGPGWPGRHPWMSPPKRLVAFLKVGGAELPRSY